VRFCFRGSVEPEAHTNRLEGDGVCLRVDNVWHQGHFIIRRSLIARNGNRFKLDQPLNDDDFTVAGHASGSRSSLCSPACFSGSSWSKQSRETGDRL